MTGDAPDVDALAALVGLTLTPGQKPGVSLFLGIARDMAAVVAAVPLDEERTDLAPVFRLPEAEHAA